MRVLVLWTQLTGYMELNLRVLSSEHDVIIVRDHPRLGEYLFDFSSLDGVLAGHFFSDEMGATDWKSITAWNPDVIWSGGWHRKEFRRFLARHKSAIRILSFDTQYLGTVRQKLGLIGMRFFRGRWFDRAFVPGKRQIDFALRCGFKEEEVGQGVFSAVSNGSRAVYSLDSPFVFVGRLSHEKGLIQLVDAHQEYVKLFPTSARRLVLVGTGPLSTLLSNRSGVDCVGFQQPAEVNRILSQGYCFVLSSSREAWGVALLEAATCGLPLIVTKEVGASEDLGKDNSLVLNSNDKDLLLEALIEMHKMTESSWIQKSELSLNLAADFSIIKWKEEFDKLVSPK